ncbi:hypothetical protein P43SY_001800 [Pythium insidiosum]|uniref:Uncharacterized protein n=1 Tax=Pythium insidiosum TaxID=114742 RepID=A0AAD5LNK8_PYTIN|nr:hypothetical protein P43SY_001800 [Pythium insidiosum]
MSASTRPSTASSRRQAPAPLGRPQSAAGLAVPASPSNRNGSVFTPAKDKASASSDELIRDLESKVRKVVEQKRAESDRLRFAVAKRRDEVEKAKLVLQDLLKDSEALGLHYQLPGATGDKLDVAAALATTEQPEDDPTRLQPVVSISRRPVYTKHTKIHELEAKLERRAKEAHQVYRRTLVLEHIKKRLVNERIDVAQLTNVLKQRYSDLTHQTQELQKKDIAAGEAVNQEQTRLAQQKADMAESERKFKYELALRQKWAKEKAKFERYYSDQLKVVAAKAAQAREAGAQRDANRSLDRRSPERAQSCKRQGLSPTNAAKLMTPEEEDADEQRHRDAFQRIGVDCRAEGIDPEEIVRICLSHEELKKELDAKHDEAVERIAQLRAQIGRMRSVQREDIPLSKRGTSQKIETKQLEISVVERQLATVVEQYMFVDQSVRPIKIGLQQVLQTVSNATVNIDDTLALEKTLVESCEEMMRLLRETSVSHLPSVSENQNADGPADDGPTNANNESLLSLNQQGAVSFENFTSPFNVRVPVKKHEPYHFPGLTRPQNEKSEDDAQEEDVFEVMDRAMVKRVSSVVVCMSVGKKHKAKPRNATAEM